MKVSREAGNRSKRAQRRSLRRRGLTIALSLVLIWLAPLVARAEVDTIKAAQVKAAYLRYIAEFTTWPPEALGEDTEPIVLGTIGSVSSPKHPSRGSHDINSRSARSST